jgi:hypothetical protein
MWVHGSAVASRVRNGSIWVGDGTTGIPDPRILQAHMSGMGLDPSPSNTDVQYGTGMGLAPSPTRSAGRNLVPGMSSGMGLVPRLSHTGRRYWTRMGPGPFLTRS